MSEPCRGGCKDLTDYYASGQCATPYCPGWNEVHCRACGWYTTSCPCGACNGRSRLSTSQERSIQRRKLAKEFTRDERKGA